MRNENRLDRMLAPVFAWLESWVGAGWRTRIAFWVLWIGAFCFGGYLVVAPFVVAYAWPVPVEAWPYALKAPVKSFLLMLSTALVYDFVMTWWEARKARR